MPENSPSPAGSLGKLSKPQRSIEGCLAELIVRYHRYPSIEVARMIRQLETELANAALFGGAVRDRNGNR